MTEKRQSTKRLRRAFIKSVGAADFTKPISQTMPNGDDPVSTSGTNALVRVTVAATPALLFSCKF